MKFIEEKLELTIIDMLKQAGFEYILKMVSKEYLKELESLIKNN